MEFVNLNESFKVRISTKEGYVWKTAYKGKSIELPKEVGFANGLQEVKVEVEEEVPKKNIRKRKFRK